MMPPDSDVYFNAPGTASVRWDPTSKLVQTFRRCAPNADRNHVDKCHPKASATDEQLEE